MQHITNVNNFSSEALKRIQAYDLYRRSREEDIPSPSDTELPDLISFSAKTLQTYDIAISQEYKNIDEFQAQITALQQKISQARSYIDELRDQKLGLEQHVSQCKRLQSASRIRSLPYELLCEIFLHYVGNQAPSLSDGKVRFRAKSSVRTIGKVCSKWRHLSISFPALWSRIHWLNFAGHDAEKDTWALEHFLSRTRGTAVHIKIFFASQFYPEFAGILLRRAPHLLSLCKSSCSVVQQLVDVSNTGLTLNGLDTLQLRSFSELESANVDLSRVVANVKTLNLIGHFDPSFRMAWTNVTRISFEGCSWMFALHALEHCENLQSLAISACNARSNQVWHPVILEQLKELSIYHHLVGPDGFSEFIGALTAPNLSNLSIYEESISPLPLSEFIKRSGCSISTFSVHSRAPSSRSRSLLDITERHVEYVKCIPCVEVFHWSIGGSQCYDTVELPNILSRLHPSEISLPQLRRLELQLDRSVFTESAFMELVRSRFNPYMASYSRGLQSVALVVRKGIFNDAHWRPLQEMQEQGLQVSVRDEKGCAGVLVASGGKAGHVHTPPSGISVTSNFRALSAV